MPLVRISLPADTGSEEIRSASDAIHAALTVAFNVPAKDRFHIVHRHRADELICTDEFLEVRHSRRMVLVHISVSSGRTLAMKQDLYRHIAEGIASATTFLPADVIINLSETSRENWSFGNGIAQYAQ